MADAGFFVGGLIFAFFFASFIEFMVHYLMHRRVFLGKVHTDHHADGRGQGWIGEFQDYIVPSLPLMGLMVLGGWLIDEIWLGVGMAVGSLFYCLFAAYAHQVQHEHPELTFWMRRPVHTIHHIHNQWHHNFGIGMDIWDRLFGTYRPMDWKRVRPVRLRDFFLIHWRTPAELDAAYKPPKREAAAAAEAAAFTPQPQSSPT